MLRCSLFWLLPLALAILVRAQPLIVLVLVRAQPLTVLLLIRVYFPCPFQWGSPTFNAGEAFVMMAASFVSLSEVGTISLNRIPCLSMTISLIVRL